MEEEIVPSGAEENDDLNNATAHVAPIFGGSQVPTNLVPESKVDNTNQQQQDAANEEEDDDETEYSDDF